jgi:GNAT superfamily N-acetyltransferase
MADMLVKLYNLPDARPLLARLEKQNIWVYRDNASNKPLVVNWVREYFNDSWANGCEAAYNNRPPTNWIAVERQPAPENPSSPYDMPAERLLGFACSDAGYRGIFGPTGVREDCRGRGIGAALLLACLYGMASDGYPYAVIHWVGPAAFYERVAGAVLIPDSEPSFARGRLIS